MNKTFLVSLPSDGNGFIGRACDSPSCKQYFKIRIPDHKDTLNCPYCGTLFSKNSLLTREQFDHVRRSAVEEARVYAIDEIQKMFKNALRGSKNITYKPGSRPAKRPVVPRYIERDVDTELQCSECDTQFQVYGIFGYPLRSLIYTAADRAVTDSFVDGEAIMRDRRILTLDEDDALDRLEAAQHAAEAGVPALHPEGLRGIDISPLVLPLN
ncbi:MAG: hypothetical protein ACT4P4_16325 [Betaproteobacteria bacterium]